MLLLSAVAAGALSGCGQLWEKHDIGGTVLSSEQTRTEVPLAEAPDPEAAVDACVAPSVSAVTRSAVAAVGAAVAIGDAVGWPEGGAVAHGSHTPPRASSCARPESARRWASPAPSAPPATTSAVETMRDARRARASRAASDAGGAGSESGAPVPRRSSHPAVRASTAATAPAPPPRSIRRRDGGRPERARAGTESEDGGVDRITRRSSHGRVACDSLTMFAEFAEFAEFDESHRPR